MTEKGYSGEVSAAGKVEVELQGFDPEEIIKIPEGTNDLHHAFFSLGRATKSLTEERLKQVKKEAGLGEEEILKASLSLQNLIDLSEGPAKNIFVTADGQNHLKRYINALTSFNLGNIVPRDLLALLQLEDQTGCQTLLVQNGFTKEVAGFHIEEDEKNYGEGKDPLWGKRWVEMKVEGRKIRFCSYGGILSFGTTSGIVETPKGIFLQAADFISPSGEGRLWANAFAFMTMDCADISQIRELVENINRHKDLLPEPIFSGGYILQMVQADFGKSPRVFSLEFGENILRVVEPKKVNGRLILAGANLPLEEHLREVDFYNLPRGVGESSADYEDRKTEGKLMERRLRRLSLIGGLVGKSLREDGEGWGKENSLKVVKGVLASKHGENLGEWFTGFSNYVVAQHDFFYLSPKGEMKLIVRKGSPDRYSAS
jgi:hypothetical protein